MIPIYREFDVFESQQKVTPEHINRNAYLYIRQSTLKQLVENQESTKRQYALRDRAISLGWPRERVIVIDSDTGQSGAESEERKGFQKLVAEVGMGKAGIVMGLEVSRLARNSSDWHRLLEICALTNTLILDEDGIYEPGHFNDRLLLGLKGTMSEAELHILKARLRGGVLNKARRGELKLPLPVGFVHDHEDRVVLDPDKEVQASIRHLFKSFSQTGSVYLTVKAFRRNSLKFPRRPHTGPSKGELVWGPLSHSHALRILHNPRYAGSFVYGKTRQPKGVNGGVVIRKVPRDQWYAFFPDSHEGYISFEEFEANERQISENAQAFGADRPKRSPREGPAFLQGLAVCGKCGHRMTIRYHQRKDRLVPDYICQKDKIEYAESICQSIPGAGIDDAIGALLVKMMSPVALKVSLRVQQEIEKRMNDVENLRRKKVARAQYEADLARRRYMSVDPQNRLVADSLESEWNEKLRALHDAQEEFERECEKDRRRIDEVEREKIMSLATDFPKLWNNPNTPDRERKRMVRLLVEDVTLLRESDTITAGIRFKGGATKLLDLPLPLNYCMARKTSADVVQEIDMLLDTHKGSQVAAILNEKGIKSGDGLPFTNDTIFRILGNYKLKSRRTRLRQKGLLTRREMMALLGVASETLQLLKEKKLLNIMEYGDSPSNILYERPSDEVIEKVRRNRTYGRKAILKSLMENEISQEVQYEA